MNISSSIFRAYDIRGIVKDDLTPAAVYEIGRAFGSQAAKLNQKKIVIARDGRLSSPELSIALAEGLQVTGRDVIDIGLVPTPVLYFATYELNTGSGIMITGSHNPPEYNGIKMMLAGETLHGESIMALRDRIINEEFVEGEGSLSTQDIKEAYIQRITNDIKLERPLKIAIDCGNGAAGEIAVSLFKGLGLDAIELYCVIDGTFPNHHPNPSVEENLQDLRDTVKREKLDLGIAFDGDGDRLGVIDGDGNIIWPDRQMILFSKDILKRQPGANIIFDVKCSRHLKEAIANAGGKPVMSKTGHSLIKAKLKETGALLAGEMSGHIFFKERWYGFDDGLYSAARLLEILSKNSITPTAVFNELPNSVNTPELNIAFEEGEHYKFIEKLQTQANFPDADITSIDGIRADFSDGWGLVRASNTTPCLVLRFEASDEQSLIRIQDLFKKELCRIKPDIDLPF